MLLTDQGPYEVLTDLFHDLGVQSNILVSATYAHRGSGILTPARVSSALLLVIHEHPALWLIGVKQPSQRKEGNNRMWEARLPSIIFKDCVQFVNENNEGDAGILKIFKKAHNQWFDTGNKSKPWWKLIVVNGRNLIFLYHHSIGDGLCGYAFHRSFLAALNLQ